MPRAAHGTTTRYRRHKCRCEPCKAANAEANRRWRANRRGRGDVYRRKDRVYMARRPCSACGTDTRAQGPTPLCKPCSLHSRRMVHVPKVVRLAIYERDGWICQVCSQPVEPGLPHTSPWQATLDHIAPRSRGGTDDPENLRLAHRYCNAVRSNRDGLTLDDLAA